MKRNATLASVLMLFAAAASAQTFTPIRVNCGGAAYTDANGNVWQADTGFTGGLAYSQANAAISPLDSSIRYASQGGSFIYTFTVPNGAYTVNLGFEELWGSHRSINVLINGATVLSQFDVFAKAGSALDVESIPVNVSTGGIVIEVDSLGGNGYLDSIEILSATPPVPQTLPFQMSFPGFGTGLGFTVSVPGGTIIPNCSLSDGNCSLTLQITDCNGKPVIAITPGCAVTLSIFKASNLPVQQTSTTLLASVTSP